MSTFGINLVDVETLGTLALLNGASELKIEELSAKKENINVLDVIIVLALGDNVGLAQPPNELEMREPSPVQIIQKGSG